MSITDPVHQCVNLENINMNRRLVIFIGSAFILLGLGALVYFGYRVFYAPQANRTANEEFYLEQSTDVKNAADQLVIVRSVFYPPAGQAAEWNCVVRVWDWGEGEPVKDEECTEFVADTFLVYPFGHVYSKAGTYPVKMYLWGPDGKTYATETLNVKAK